MARKKHLGVVVDNETYQRFDEKCKEMGTPRPQFFRDVVQALIEDRLRIIPGERDKHRKTLLSGIRNAVEDT